MLRFSSTIAGAALVSLACAQGCSDAAAGGAPSDPDAGVIDAAPERCVAPRDAPPWLEGALAEHVAKLSGDREIASGARLTDRASPAARAATRAYLTAVLASVGVPAVEEAYSGGSNVVARLPATSPSPAGETVVVGAHFDGAAGSPGANDNATGVALVLAVARALRDLPCRGRDVLFVLFDQEEGALVGSNAFATARREAAANLVAVHTIDQVGWDADGDRTFEIEKPTPALLAEYVAGADAVGAKVVETKTTSSDHQSFRSRGFPAAGVTEEYVSGDTTPHYHAPTDTAATVEPQYHALAVRLVSYVVARELGADP